MMQLNDILQLADERGASDVHLIPDHPPLVRVNTDIQPLGETPLTRDQTRAFLETMTSERQRTTFQADLDLDFSHAVEGLGRYRVNARYRNAVAPPWRCG